MILVLLLCYLRAAKDALAFFSLSLYDPRLLPPVAVDVFGSTWILVKKAPSRHWESPLEQLDTARDHVSDGGSSDDDDDDDDGAVSGSMGPSRFGLGHNPNCLQWLTLAKAELAAPVQVQELLAQAREGTAAYVLYDGSARAQQLLQRLRPTWSKIAGWPLLDAALDAANRDPVVDLVVEIEPFAGEDLGDALQKSFLLEEEEQAPTALAAAAAAPLQKEAIAQEVQRLWEQLPGPPPPGAPLLLLAAAAGAQPPPLPRRTGETLCAILVGLARMVSLTESGVAGEWRCQVSVRDGNNSPTALQLVCVLCNAANPNRTNGVFTIRLEQGDFTFAQGTSALAHFSARLHSLRGHCKNNAHGEHARTVPQDQPVHVLRGSVVGRFDRTLVLLGPLLETPSKREGALRLVFKTVFPVAGQKEGGSLFRALLEVTPPAVEQRLSHVWQRLLPRAVRLLAALMLRPQLAPGLFRRLAVANTTSLEPWLFLNLQDLVDGDTAPGKASLVQELKEGWEALAPLLLKRPDSVLNLQKPDKHPDAVYNHVVGPRTLNWLQGLDGGPDEEGADEGEAFTVAEQGLRAHVDQDLKSAEVNFRYYLIVLQGLWVCSRAALRLRSGGRDLPENVVAGVEALLADLFGRLRSDMGTATRTATANRIQLLERNLFGYTQFWVGIKRAFVLSMRAMQELMDAVSMELLLAQRSYQGRHPSATVPRDYLVRSVLLPALLEPYVTELVHRSVLLAQEFLLVGQRAGARRFTASQLFQSPSVQQEAHRVPTYLGWSSDGSVTYISSNDKTARTSGAMGAHLPLLAAPAFFLAELVLLVQTVFAQDRGASVMMVRAKHADRSRVTAPVLLQRLTAGALSGLTAEDATLLSGKQRRRKKPAVTAQVLEARTPTTTHVFALFQAGLQTNWEELTDTRFWPVWVAGRCGGKGRHVSDVPLLPPTLACPRMARLFKEISSWRGAPLVPDTIRTNGALRVAAAAVTEALGDNNPTLLAAVAQVQQHSQQTHLNVYTPSARFRSCLTGSVYLQRHLGFGHGGFGSDYSSAPLQEAQAQLKALMPLPNLLYLRNRLHAASALGLPWTTQPYDGPSLASYLHGLDRSLAALVLAGEQSSLAQGYSSLPSLALPFPGHLKLGDVCVPCVSLSAAPALFCTDCQNYLFLVRRPVLERGPWTDLQVGGRPLDWFGPVEAQVLKDVPGVLVCQTCMSENIGRFPIKAVCRTTQLVFDKGVTREEAIEVWPSVEAMLVKPSFKYT